MKEQICYIAVAMYWEHHRLVLRFKWKLSYRFLHNKKYPVVHHTVTFQLFYKTILHNNDGDISQVNVNIPSFPISVPENRTSGVQAHQGIFIKYGCKRDIELQ